MGGIGFWEASEYNWRGKGQLEPVGTPVCLIVVAVQECLSCQTARGSGHLPWEPPCPRNNNVDSPYSKQVCTPVNFGTADTHGAGDEGAPLPQRTSL